MVLTAEGQRLITGIETMRNTITGLFKGNTHAVIFTYEVGHHTVFQRFLCSNKQTMKEVHNNSGLG